MFPTIHHKLAEILENIDSLQRELHPEHLKTPERHPTYERRLPTLVMTERRDYSRSVPPSINRFPKEARQKVGPGYYQSPDSPPNAGNTFGGAPRFAESLLDKISNYDAKSTRISPRDREVIRTRLAINRNLALHKPQAKLEVLKKRAKLMTIREQIAKQVKEAMISHEINARLLKLKIKENKLELRLRKDESLEVCKAWLILMSGLGAAYTGYRMALNRKRLHGRSSKVMGFFLIMSITCGKIMRKIRRHRCKASLMKLQVMRFYVMRWIKNHRKRTAAKITETVEDSLSRNFFAQVLFLWRSKLLRLQRGMLYCLLIKKILYRRLSKLWDSVPAAKKDVVPQAVKVIYLRTAVKEKVKAYSQQLKDWKSAVEDSAYELHGLDEASRSLPRPTLCLRFTKEEFAELDFNAKLRRNRWDYMIHRDRQLRM